MASEKTAAKQRGKPFPKGVSGNPEGRPIGSRNKVTLAVESLLDGEAEVLTRKAIELAKGGDIAALRLCFDRILSPRKDRPVSFALPAISSPKEAAATISAVLAAVAAGDISPAEGSEVGKLVDTYVKAVEAADLVERLERLERMTAK
ncbi:MAG: DUF5681 domain-containing protein [Pseudolabrys sp.]|nr:DUF5681 domain-containing protein [Pseudolabrys sp.]